MSRQRTEAIPVEREKKIYCGKDWLEVGIFPAFHLPGGRGRRARQKESCPAQKNLNDRNARRYFCRLVISNFGEGDFRLDLTYNREHLPETPEEMKRNADRFIRRLRYARQKLGLPSLKYVLVSGYGINSKTGKLVRPHHHLIVNGGLDVREVLACWRERGKGGVSYGYVSYSPLQIDPDTGIAGLANYLAEQPMAGKRRWSGSHNLKKPEYTTNDSRYRRRQVERLILTEAYKAYGAECRKLINYEAWCAKYPGWRLVEYAPEFNEAVGAWYLDLRFTRVDTGIKKGGAYGGKGVSSTAKTA